MEEKEEGENKSIEEGKVWEMPCSEGEKIFCWTAGIMSTDKKTMQCHSLSVTKPIERVVSSSRLFNVGCPIERLPILIS